tara:strand:- start:1802 stop:2929 length:1128 start_codon:yes stop_codon:yes gene_type:complete
VTKSQIHFERKTVGLLLVGGLHHVLHLIPIAVELEAHPNIDVEVFVLSTFEAEACQRVLTPLGAERTKIRVLNPNPIAKLVSPKLAFLLLHLNIWNSLNAIVVVERTSTILRYFSGRLPPFIHIPHGAGDRAKSYDPRIRHFDHVLVAGEKDKRRMVELGLVREDTCSVTGYIKPFAIKQLRVDMPSIFPIKRPTVLYNPHFSRGLSSWKDFGHELLEAFSKKKDMNFIVAPHVRLFANQNEFKRDEIEVYSKFENIHVDLGSSKSSDMSYTRAADIYLGDVSSQVYEFLSEPKPCIFLTKRTTQWQGNPDYAHWSFGPVCYSVSEVLANLDRAFLCHPDYAELQEKGCLAATGDPSWNPIRRAADALMSILANA